MSLINTAPVGIKVSTECYHTGLVQIRGCPQAAILERKRVEKKGKRQ